MAIKNTELGGTDWAPGEFLNSTDLNDTFDAAYAYLQKLSNFWLNSDLYDAYDDFESYSLGAFTTNSKWTVGSVTGDGTVTIVSDDTPTGSTSKVLQLDIGDGDTSASNVTVNTILLADNKHKHIKCALKSSQNSSSGSEWGNIAVKLGSSGTEYNLLEESPEGNNSILSELYFDVSVVAKGSGDYDLYFGGRLMEAGISEADPQLYFIVSTQFNQTIFQIDDVVESGSSI